MTRPRDLGRRNGLMLLERSTVINASLADVFAFFSDPQNLARITPPWLSFEIRSCPDRALRAGDQITYRIRLFGVPMRWVTRITSMEQGRHFSDLQERGPYRRWLHTHRFTEVPEGVRMDDLVEYELPFGPLGRLAHALFVRRQLQAIFDFREETIRSVFRR